MNLFEMTVLIVLIVMVASIIKQRNKYRAGYRRDGDTPSDPDTRHMRAEIAALRDRIQVLERVITDNHSASDLDREIAALRDRR